MTSLVTHPNRHSLQITNGNSAKCTNGSIFAVDTDVIFVRVEVSFLSRHAILTLPGQSRRVALNVANDLRFDLNPAKTRARHHPIQKPH
jgi:hypothetical protein